MRKYIFMAFSVLLSLPGFTESLSFKNLKSIPIQQGGRIKPLDTFAREVVQTVTGKSSFQGMPAIDLLFSWLMNPDHWGDVPAVEIQSLELKKRLGLDLGKKYFSQNQLQDLNALEPDFQTIHLKTQNEEKLTPQEENVNRLFTQISLLQRVRSGEVFSVIAHPQDPHQPWFSFVDLEPSQALRSLYLDAESLSKIEELKVILQGISHAYVGQDASTFYVTTTKLKQLLSELPKVEGYPFSKTISLEIFYNEFHPFRKAWIFYVMAVILLSLLTLTSAKAQIYLRTIGLAVSGVAFLSHVLGFYFRCVISGRAPVGNMYESVVWVSLGVMLFAYLLFYKHQKTGILVAACVVSAIGLILSDNLPMILDPSIRPLAPVLRSNFWLTIHVLTITLSYAAFALVMALGNWVLVKYALGHDVQDIRGWVKYSYQAMQIGVLLLAAGTILGGVWADYSWGRFWGWDPKEVWALIALLLYLAVIHGRYAGWLNDFWMTAASILAFQGVLMAWYGVNFVLGVGLHSYGFGSGGLLYVLMYVAIQVLFIGGVWCYKIKSTSFS
ncbi:MAG: cytochrome c biogenesis protein CcsA [Deltaproteobacteria bacterium]|nr:cytochrome c biogenesis protein CcsA [Deltaproteobacteria bacterium]